MRLKQTIRAHLFVLVLSTMLPILGFAAYVSSLLIEQDRESIRRGAIDRARALLTAVDADLSGSISTLEALATAGALLRQDMPTFHLRAVRVLKTQENWLNITLALPADLQQVVNTGVPYGTPLRTLANPESAHEVVRTGRPAVGSLTAGFVVKIPAVPVRVPVMLEGKVAYVLTAAVNPKAFEDLIRAQKLPQGSVIALIDREGRFVARIPTREPGTLASPSFRETLRGSPEGWFRGTTSDGVDTYTAFVRSEYSGWTVGFAIPVSVIESGSRRTMSLLAAGALIAILLAFLVATLIARRISNPIVSLAASARAIGQGDPASTLPLGHVREFGAVAAALTEAGKEVQEQRRMVERERDALVSADRAKDEFIAMLSHEMRNPLAALNAAAQVLKIADPTQEAAANARGVIERQTAHMTRLIEDLLDINRVVMGKATLLRAPLDLGELASEVVLSWRDSGRSANHRIELTSKPVPLVADRARLEQVLSNLLDNAQKFSPAGTTVRVEVFRDGTDAVLRVTDEGAGMDPATIERMFELFVQGDQGLARRTGGLGVGLALVKKLIALHGGSVTAASDGPGRGASFTVRLPASS